MFRKFSIVVSMPSQTEMIVFLPIQCICRCVHRRVCSYQSLAFICSNHKPLSVFCVVISELIFSARAAWRHAGGISASKDVACNSSLFSDSLWHIQHPQMFILNVSEA